MWESPIYKFKAEVGGQTETVLIDVTGSAPSFTEPGKQLENAFKVVLDGLNPSRTKIVDFGAAKLRNTLYLLKKGYTVYSCEFDDLFKRSKQASESYALAKKFKNFKRLVFPGDFIQFDEHFDVALLINVVNIMPVPIERLCALALLRDKMKPDGRLLWYTQHGVYSEADAYGKLYDGLVTGKGREYHMFYRDFSRKEIHELLASTGFSYNEEFKFPRSGNNQAYVFNSDGVVLVDKTLGLTELLRRGSQTELADVTREVRWSAEGKQAKSTAVAYETKVPVQTKKIAPLNLQEKYITELKTISPGGGERAAKYHQLVFNILKFVFDPQLKNPQKEEKINQGRKRVDITFENKAESGFFVSLKDRYNIPCPIIFIECKNRTKALETPEYDQIEGRLNQRRGMFGIIVCRKMSDKKATLDHCRDMVRENPGAEKYVIVLDDDDIRAILNHKIHDEVTKLERVLEDKLKQLIL